MIKQADLPGPLAEVKMSDAAWAQLTDDQKISHNKRLEHLIERWAEAGGTQARPAVVALLMRQHKSIQRKRRR